MPDLEEEFKAKNVGGIDWLKLKPSEINAVIDGINTLADAKVVLKKMAIVLWFYINQELRGR